MKLSRPFAAILLVVAFVGAAAHAVPHAQGPAQTQTLSLAGYPAPGAPPAVQLLTAGDEPRKALRYTIAPDYAATADMTMNMSMAMNTAGMSVPMDLPGLTMTMALTVTGVTPAGDVTYDIRFTGMSIDTASASNPALAAAIEPMRASLTSMKGRTTISNRGLTRSASFTTADTAVQQLMNQMTGSAENLSNPLPEEPVGVGATWEVRQALTSGGQTSFQKATYELVSMDGATVTLKIATEQTAPPQTITNPDLPAGTDTHLETLTGAGAGTATIRLHALVPTSEMAVTNSMTMSISMGGQTQSVGTDTKIRLTIAPSK